MAEVILHLSIDRARLANCYSKFELYDRWLRVLVHLSISYVTPESTLCAS